MYTYFGQIVGIFCFDNFLLLSEYPKAQLGQDPPFKGARGHWTKLKDMCFAGAWLAFLTSIGEMCAKSRCEAPVMPSGRRRLHPDYTFIQPEWQMYHWCPACCRCAFSPILGHITIVRPNGEKIQGVDLFLPALQILKRISFDWSSKARQFNLGKL